MAGSIHKVVYSTVKHLASIIIENDSTDSSEKIHTWHRVKNITLTLLCHFIFHIYAGGIKIMLYIRKHMQQDDSQQQI